MRASSSHVNGPGPWPFHHASPLHPFHSVRSADEKTGGDLGYYESSTSNEQRNDIDVGVMNRS